MKVLEEVITSDGVLSVVSRDNMLALRNGDIGYSCIFTDNEVFQPILIPVQKVAEAYSDFHTIHNAVILGGGCCTIPRFLIKRFKNTIQIDSVEYLSAIVELTRKYFLNGIDTNKLNIINDDAYKFIHNTSNQYDFIFVDLFVGGVKSEKSHTRDFLSDLVNHSTKQAIIVFNGYHSSLEQCRDLFQQGKTYFKQSLILRDESETCYIVFTNESIDERTVKQYILPT
jgi:spermidine synthase